VLRCLLLQRALATLCGTSLRQGDERSRQRPTLPDQRRIVAEVERRLSLVDALAAATTAALKRSAALRRSILERAFTGKLVPQDPRDESASTLLERIRAQREAAGASKRQAVAPGHRTDQSGRVVIAGPAGYDPKRKV